MTPDLISAMKSYSDATHKISDLEKQRDAAKAAILSLMRERGLEKVEGGGFRASISTREFFGFNECDEAGERLDDDEVRARLEALHESFADFAPTLDVPASTNIAKLVDVMVARGAIDTKALPGYLKVTQTPILRVSGGGV